MLLKKLKVPIVCVIFLRQDLTYLKAIHIFTVLVQFILLISSQRRKENRQRKAIVSERSQERRNFIERHKNTFHILVLLIRTNDTIRQKDKNLKVHVLLY